MKSKEIFGFYSNVLMVILELVGLINMLCHGNARNFIFYTTLSNTFALITSAVYVVGYCRFCKKAKMDNLDNVNLDNEVSPNKLKIISLPRYIRTLRFMSSICLTVTFVVVMVVLLPQYLPQGTAYKYLFSGSQTIFHVICPLLSLLSFFTFEKGLLNTIDVYLATLPTILYGIIFVILNVVKVVEGPYPFLKVYDQPVYASILYFIGILGSAFAFSKLVHWIDNKISKE